MVAQDEVVEPSAVAGWSESLGELHRRIRHRFARSEARERARRYLLGLLGRVECKNGFYEKGILVKCRRGGGDHPPKIVTTAPLRLLLSAFALGRLSRDLMHGEVRPARRRCNLAVGLLWQRDHPFLRSRHGPGVSGVRRKSSLVGSGSLLSVSSNVSA